MDSVLLNKKSVLKSFKLWKNSASRALKEPLLVNSILSLLSNRFLCHGISLEVGVADSNLYFFSLEFD